MSGSGADSNLLLKGSFQSEPIVRIFSAAEQMRGWLLVEAALARAEAQLGIVPDNAAVKITKVAEELDVDLDEVRAAIEVAAHPLMPVVNVLSTACGEEGQYVHWGATTQDILDTALVLQLRQTADEFTQVSCDLQNALVDLAERARGDAMPGRTHSQHAVPITFGYKVAVWADELHRLRTQFQSNLTEVMCVQFGGAAGTLAATGVIGFDIREKLAGELHLTNPSATWHTSRDRLATFAFPLLQMAILAQKIGREVTNLQRTEIAEVEEGFYIGKVGSSTMPQKRNPSLAQNLNALGTLAQGEFGVLIASSVQGHERDMAAWQIEWDCLPRFLNFAHRAVSGAERLIGGLKVNSERMASNIHMTSGLIHSEQVMMQLAPALGRQGAHDVVYNAAMSAFANGTNLLEEIRKSGEVDDVTLADLTTSTEDLQSAKFSVDKILEQLGAES